MNLSRDAALWPMPAARDHKGANSEEYVTAIVGGKHMDQLANFVAFSPQAQAIQDGATSSADGPTSRPRLNPTFGCGLMGIPSLWTNPEVCNSDQLEMAAYRSQLQLRLSHLLDVRG
jgi:hypothetical protein